MPCSGYGFVLFYMQKGLKWMMNNKEIGTRIAVLRKGMGDSQAKLAERLDVSPQAVSKWETGVSQS